MTKLVFYLFCLFSLGSCAFHRGSLISNPTDIPVVHKDIAIGVAKSHNFIGIGGLSKDALIFEARQNLIKSHLLKNSEQFNNISIDVKTTFFMGLTSTKVTMIADVIEPKKNPEENSYADLYLKKTRFGLKYADDLFFVADTVIYKLYKKAEIIGFEGRNYQRVRISYLNKNNKLVTKSKNNKHLYAIVQSYKGLKLGDTLHGGKIKAFGKSGLLIDKKREIELVDY